MPAFTAQLVSGLCGAQHPHPSGRRSLRRVSLWICLVLLLVQADHAHAQQASTANDAGLIERRIRDRVLPEPPEDAVVPRFRTPAVPAPEIVEPVKLVLAAVVIEGATAFAATDFIPLYEEFLGRAITEADIERILARITGLYRDNGYFLSTAIAPRQDLISGLVRVRIVEGYVESVSFRNAGSRRDELEPYVRNIVAERPLRLATLERGVLLMNDLPGIEATASMRPAQETPGAHELIVDVDADAADGSFFFNNWGTNAVGPLQTWLSGGLNSTMGFGERLQAGFFTVPNQPQELLYGEFAYVHPLDTNGTFLSVGGALTRVDEGDGSAADSRSGRATVRAWHPVIRSQNENLWLSGTFDYYDLEQKDDGETTAKDRLRVVRAGFNYWRADELAGNTFLTGEVSQGLPILNASRSSEPDLTTFKGRSDFTKFTLTAAREQKLTKAIGAQVSVSAQKSLNRLLSSEQFGYGGSQFGAAYDFFDLAGDDGAAGGVELRYGQQVGWRWLKAYQLFGGYDVSLVWNDGDGSATARDSLASLGGGVRLTFAEGLFGTLQFAHGLTAFDSTEGDGGSRLSFTVTAQF